jgi:NADH-quinone oxidoreductase subunit N
LLAVAVVMLLAGLAFRMTAVPFHFYSPDVFQGGPFSAAAMLAVVPKMAGLVALIRLLAPALPGGDEVSLSGVAGPVLWWLAVLSMVLGNLLALVQTDLRRLLAFSSVAHAGYMLAGLAVGRAGGSSPTGVEATLFYLVVYAAMTLGVFAALTVLGGANRKVASIQDLAGLARSRPAVALLLGLCLLSLTGLPPTAGFLGKLNLLLACWSAGTAAGQWLAFWIVLSAAIGAAYYLRLVGILFLQEPVQLPSGEQETPAWVAMCVCTAATVVMFFVPGGLWQAVQNL